MFLPQKSQLLPLCLVVLLGTVAFADEYPCSIHDDGKYYDLSPLKSNSDYEVKDSFGQKIILNVCQSVKTELFGLGDDIQAGDVGGAVRRGHGYFSFGKFNTTLDVVDSRPRIVMSEGSPCKAKVDDKGGDIRGSSIVEFICDKSVFGPGLPRLVAQLPPGDNELGCGYVIEWKTKFACPTSEGGGVWGFFAILAVVFLVLLMAYTVLGTLYNRYVLQLRGFDQIPQFSIESMKYHGKEAWDWTKDIIAALNIGGSRGHSGYNGAPSSAINPFSHQSQVSGFGNTDDFEGGGGGFIRPQVSTTRSNSFQTPATNPVSHQTQVNAALAGSLSFKSPPGSHSPPQQPPHGRQAPTKLVAEVREPTAEERDFMLGDDDEDAEELIDVKAPPLASSNTSSPSQNLPSTGISRATSGLTESAEAARGRNLGEHDTIRL